MPIFAGGQLYVGNGYCDDGLNTAECNFDAGDCCDPSANTDYCNICQCLSGKNGTTPNPQTSSGNTGLSSSSFTTGNIWTSHCTVVINGMKIGILNFVLGIFSESLGHVMTKKKRHFPKLRPKCSLAKPLNSSRHFYL